MSIKNELNEQDGIKSVEGDPENKQITIEWESPITLDKIKEKGTEMNNAMRYYSLGMRTNG
jgi:copper chaperone CopZ